MKSSDHKRVFVALHMANVSGQQKLAGIFRYLRARYGKAPPWELQIVRTRTEFTKACLKEAIEQGTDGYIVSIPECEHASDLLRTVDRPTVAMDILPPSRKTNLVVIRNDNASAGRLAAANLLSLGTLRHYAFVHATPVLRWGMEREASYRATIRDHGLWCDTYGEPGETRELGDFLASLPKPCGIFAATDGCGYRVLGLCQRLGLRVPEEIAVIGLDNDPLICENCKPPLTSISADYEQEGYLAAQALNKMMSATKRPVTVQVLRMPVSEIVCRESTSRASSGGLLVQRAIAFINANALKGIGVPDVVRHLRVSRRLADLRFRQLQGRTIHDAIAETRLNKVRELLTTTNDSIDDIAFRCGYSNPNYLRNLFKRTYNVSMRDFRRLPRI